MTNILRGLGLAWILCALGGCAAQRAIVSGAPALQGRDAVVELEDTPFHPQEALQCGPAALATVLGAAGTDVHPDTLAREVYTPGLGGSLQLELAAAARARGFVPYRVTPDADALFAELLAGRPVLVMQNLRLRSWPAWHYAVVIGVDPGAERVILRSGTERRLEMPAARFLRSWDKAERWGLVLLEPGQLPAQPDRSRYFDAVAGLEEVGRYEAAAAAWEAALAPWPADSIARFGHATASYLGGDLAAARAGYEALLAREPEHAAALNNLANLLAGQGCRASARRLAARAATIAPAGSPVVAAAASTLEAIPAQAIDADDCVPVTSF
ncbi:MAG TPA: PA2778 family cysteine peptidase [Gammaproteobacteria bacterium]|nr:PA2778 family cysteine peptidase [Gammaproteobacteria bacterium]